MQKEGDIMTHLIRLELKKIHLWNYILTSVLSVAVSMFFLFVSLNDTSTRARTYADTFRTVEMIFAFIFVIFFSVLVSSVVISEYNHRTILLMFTYPLEKKKLIAAKLLLITLFMALSILTGYALCGLFILGINRQFHLITGIFTADILHSWILSAAASTISFCCLGLLTFALGMIKKSVSATIVCSMILIFLRQIVIASGETHEDPLWFVLALICVTALAVYYTFQKNLSQIE